MRFLVGAERGPLAEDISTYAIEHPGLRTGRQATKTDLIVASMAAAAEIFVLVILLASEYREQVAAAKLERTGAHVARTYHFRHSWRDSALRPVFQHLNTVYQVDLPPDVPWSEAELCLLRDLRHLNTLILEGESITDDALVHLQGLPDLDWLCLFETRITEAGLEKLSALPRLRGLTFAGTSSISAAGLTKLRGCHRLESLILTEKSVVNHHLQNLDELSGLTELTLRRTGVTDQGLAHLAGCRSLKTLILDRTPITDAGLPVLSEFPQLLRVHLSETDVTADGVAELKRLAPYLKVDWQPPDASAALAQQPSE